MDNQTIKRRFRRGFSVSLAIATALGLGLSDGIIVAPVNATVIAQAQEVSDTVTIQEVTYGEKYVETKATADDTINSPSASSNITSVTLSDGRTVSAKTYGEGEDAVTGVLTLVVDGVQCDILDYMQGKIELKEGTYSFESTKGSVAYSEMAKFGAMGGNTAQYTYRSALMIKDGEINADETIPSLLKSISEYTNTGMKGGTLKSEGAFFNGVIAEAEEQEEETTASATVNINSSEIYTSGVIRTAAATDKYNAATKAVTVKVNPAQGKVTKATSTKKGQLTVKWRADSLTSGYKVQASTSKTFKKGVKSVTIKKKGTTSVILKKLTSGKKYYVRVRTYKKVGNTTYTGAYSKAVLSNKVK